MHRTVTTPPRATVLRRVPTLAIALVLGAGGLGAQSLVNGGRVTGDISFAGDQDTWTFSATAGEGFQIRLVDEAGTTLYPKMSLYQPDGDYVTAVSGQDVCSFIRTAGETGVYSIVVEDGNTIPDETGPYAIHFTLAPGADEGGALVNGGKVTGTIDKGDLDSFTFDVNAGEGFQIRIADVDDGTLYPAMTLYDPLGAYVTAVSGQDVASFIRTAGISGTHTIVVGDGNTIPDETGTYDVYYTRAPGANELGTLLNGGFVSDTIDKGDLDSYTFDALAGEGFQLRLVDADQATLYPAMTLYDPSGAYVTAVSGASVSSIIRTAGSTGTYTLVVGDGNTVPDETGSYDLHFTLAPGANEGGRLVNGGSVTGTIDLGDLDSFTFKAEAGDGFQLRLADTSVGTLYPAMTLYDPSGAYVTAVSGASVSSMSRTAGSTGFYTVVIGDGNTVPDETGAYELHLTRALGANEGGLLLDGVPKTDQIDLGDLDSFTFLANPGDVAVITVTDTAAGTLYPRVTLYDPNGAYVTATSGPTTATISRTLSISGAHTLVVSDGNTVPDETGPYSIQVDGAGSDYDHPLNVDCPSELPTDPILVDNAGDPTRGPRIGSATDPFNVSIDCTQASAPGLYLFVVYDTKLPGPLPTQWGFFHVFGSELLSTFGAHTQSVESWFPTPDGMVLPNDAALVGIPVHVQGFCGGYSPTGRLSNALTQTIGF